MRQLPSAGAADVVLNGGVLVVVAVVIALRLVVWMRRTDERRERVDPSDRTATDGGVETGSLEMVVAYVRPEKLDDVKRGLAEASTPSVTISSVAGRGSRPARTNQYRGEEYSVDLHKAVKVECVVADVPTERVVDAIADTAYTGEPGDGKIFVLPVIDAHQIRTGDSGTEAV